MTNLKTTKRALISSVLALVMCFTMLLGTTFAWFTDSVTSTGNVIQSGKLDIQLFQHTSATTSVEITDSSDPIFGKADSETANENTADTLWEPGKTQTVYLSIKNNGNLDLKYTVALEVTNVENNLTEVVEYIITPDAKYGEVSKDDLDWTTGKSVVPGINFATAGDVALTAGGEHFFALSVHMDELAGNEYMNGNITFNIKVLAGQLASEYDSFDNQYDAEAPYPNDGSYAEVPGPDSTDTHVELEYFINGDKVATALVPVEAIAEGATAIALTADPREIPDANVSVPNGYEAITYDVTISGLKADNNVPIKVELRIPTGLNTRTVAVYHNAAPVSSVTYQAESGLVTIEATSFSPYTIVYDPNSSITDEGNPPADLPQATVTDVTADYAGEEFEWNDQFGLVPDPTLDDELEVIYQFTALETLEQVREGNYADWYCDFYVKLENPNDSTPFSNDDGSKNTIILGGNYGSFGWVGFNFTDYDEENLYQSGTEIGLLSSVTSNPWTYEMVVQNVGTFICGVGDNANELAGCTFTVMLRLTNPENANEYYDVATIPYVFPAAN